MRLVVTFRMVLWCSTQHIWYHTAVSQQIHVQWCGECDTCLQSLQRETIYPLQRALSRLSVA